MEVAIGVDRLDLVALAESEADLRLFAGMQFLALVALFGVEGKKEISEVGQKMFQVLWLWLKLYVYH